MARKTDKRLPGHDAAAIEAALKRLRAVNGGGYTRDRPARDAAVWDAMDAGASLAEVAQAAAVGQERIRQIDKDRVGALPRTPGRSAPTASIRAVNAGLKRERCRALGIRLSDIRQARGLTQTQLAQRAGLDRSFYTDVENGHHTIEVDRLHDIADALNVDIANLFDDSPVYDL